MACLKIIIIITVVIISIIITNIMRPDDKGSGCVNSKLLTPEQCDYCQQVACEGDDD